jgi:glycosyltransferase involved in cell wall biosynthesis
MHEAIDCHVFVSEMARKSFYAAPDASWTSYAHYRRQMRGLGFYRPVRAGRSVVLHNGVDTDLFTSKGRAVTTHASPFTIGTVANFEKLKGHVVLIEALSQISDKLGNWQLKLVGSGPEEGRIREAIARKGLQSRVEIVHEMFHEALPDFYRSLDLFVLPSFFEAFGCVYTEAFACGTPFIACAGQGMDDLVPESERGLWLATPGDAGDLAEKIVAYYAQRPKQHLAGEIAIDPLVRDFLCEVGGA